MTSRPDISSKSRVHRQNLVKTLEFAHSGNYEPQTPMYDVKKPCTLCTIPELPSIEEQGAPDFLNGYRSPHEKAVLRIIENVRLILPAIDPAAGRSSSHLFDTAPVFDRLPAVYRR